MSKNYPENLHGAVWRLVDGDAAPLLDGWNQVDKQDVIGHGRKAFLAAGLALSTWRVHRRAGVRVIESGSGKLCLNVGPTRHPAELVGMRNTDTEIAVAYGTCSGHWELGEEAFIIGLDSDEQVTGRCVAFSRHAVPLPGLGLGQQLITHRYLRAMRYFAAQAKKEFFLANP